MTDSEYHGLPHDRNCITYRHAYGSGETTLCGRCRDRLDRDPDSMPDLPALGPVQHGQHDQRCDLDQLSDDGETSDLPAEELQ
jgi:hypothetical protein